MTWRVRWLVLPAAASSRYSASSPMSLALISSWIFKLAAVLPAGFGAGDAKPASAAAPPIRDISLLLADKLPSSGAGIAGIRGAIGQFVGESLAFEASAAGIGGVVRGFRDITVLFVGACW